MKWRIPTYKEEYGPWLDKIIKQWEYEKEWHKSFAWWPVKISDNEKVWWEWIEWRLEKYSRIHPPTFTDLYMWQYRDYEYRLLNESTS